MMLTVDIDAIWQYIDKLICVCVIFSLTMYRWIWNWSIRNELINMHKNLGIFLSSPYKYAHVQSTEYRVQRCMPQISLLITYNSFTFNLHTSCNWISIFHVRRGSIVTLSFHPVRLKPFSEQSMFSINRQLRVFSSNNNINCVLITQEYAWPTKFYSLFVLPL